MKEGLKHDRSKRYGAYDDNDNLNLDTFESFKLVQGSIITLKVDFPNNIFEMKSDGELVGTKRIEKGWKLVPYLLTDFEDNGNDI